MANKTAGLAEGPLAGTEWTLLRRYRDKGVTYWECRCSCGQVYDVQEGNLKKGLSKRCVNHQSRLYALWKIKPTSASQVFRDAGRRFGGTTWKSLFHFVEDCYRHKPPKTRLRVIDSSKPIGPGNWKWGPVRVSMTCQAARDVLAVVLGDTARAYRISASRVYKLLKDYAVRYDLLDGRFLSIERIKAHVIERKTNDAEG